MHSVGWQGRHDAVLGRLSRAIPRAVGDVRVNQTCPRVVSDLQPDLVVINEDERTVRIVDVAVPFENRSLALVEAGNHKVNKYASLAEKYREKGYEVSLDAFILGALGSWDRANEGVLKHLRVSPRYARVLRRLMVSDVIRWSRDIYVTHVTGHQQW
uniref:Reverse transcriptase domain-containing protein n=1 Tax=Clastoptera arizonana TaxID=38151 RepID=A0A1B6CMU0_9HEMI